MMTCVRQRRPRLADRGRQHCELDPEETSVGYGGLPNAEGVVQLDSCCMHGPKKRAGGVAAIEGVRTPSLVAKRCWKDRPSPDRRQGRAELARGMGFTIENDLNTENRAGCGSNGSGGSTPSTTRPEKARPGGMIGDLQMVREG